MWIKLDKFKNVSAGFSSKKEKKNQRPAKTNLSEGRPQGKKKAHQKGWKEHGEGGKRDIRGEVGGVGVGGEGKDIADNVWLLRDRFDVGFGESGWGGEAEKRVEMMGV